MSEIESISLSQVIVEGRVRKDMGDIDELCNSIREVGLIQPIVLTRDYRLVVGERRLRALRKLSVPMLIHARTFIYNDEVDDVKLKAIECEENLKRKQFTWQEEILAKKRLLDLMQQIHGVARAGAPSRSDTVGITSPGFGINKLASLLGESNAQTSKDIELASLIEAVPILAKAETKEAARRQASLATAVAVALQQQKAAPQQTEKKWTLYEGDFVNNVNNIEQSSIDFVLVDPPYGEDAQGMGPNSKQLLAEKFKDDLASTRRLYVQLVVEAWRVLREDRFSAFFFGFEVYAHLVSSLQCQGFVVDSTPLIWVKNTVINTSPYTRYGRSYEPILIARKGEPKLFRPSQRDVIEIQNVITTGTQERKLYQAQKPVALIQKLILDMTPPGATVCDFCAGSGTTGEAAVRLGRRVVLFEKDVVACNIIRARLGAL
jgi:site-specific DNA-methyltransferase (adenine-specific)